MNTSARATLAAKVVQIEATIAILDDCFGQKEAPVHVRDTIADLQIIKQSRLREIGQAFVDEYKGVSQ